MEVGKGGEEGWRNKNGVSRGITTGIMKQLVIPWQSKHGRGHIKKEPKGKIPTSAGHWLPGA